jgi:hypothetical protein
VGSEGLDSGRGLAQADVPLLGQKAETVQVLERLVVSRYNGNCTSLVIFVCILLCLSLSRVAWLSFCLVDVFVIVCTLLCLSPGLSYLSVCPSVSLSLSLSGRISCYVPCILCF